MSQGQVDLNRQNVLVVVFAMQECPACEEYLPRFWQEVAAVQQLGYPFVAYDPGVQPAPGTIPVAVFDAAAEDAGVQDFANRYQVTGTPTTLVLARGTGSFKCEGSLAQNQIQWVLMMAAEANAAT